MKRITRSGGMRAIRPLMIGVIAASSLSACGGSDSDLPEGPLGQTTTLNPAPAPAPPLDASPSPSTTLPDPVQSPAKRQLKKSFVSLDGKQTVWYLEYLPAAQADPGRKFPLLVFFHGVGESGNPDGSGLDAVKRHGPPKLINEGQDMCFDTAEGKQCFIVVSPQHARTGRPWDLNDTLGMIDHAMKTYKVDPQRLYVTGLSMGGGAAWNIATAAVAGTNTGTNPPRYWAERIAALVPIAGAISSKTAATGICQGIVGGHLPVWAFHGDLDDRVAPVQSQAWADKINGVSQEDGYTCPAAGSPAALLTMYPGVGHDSWSQTYDPKRVVEPGKNIYQWLLSFKRP